MSRTNGHVPAPALPPVDWAPPHDDALTQLERQLVRGSHFAQAAMDKLQTRLSRAEATLAELQELLSAVGILVAEDAEPMAADAEPVVDAEDAEPVVAADDVPPPFDEDGEEVPSAGVSVSWPAIAFSTDPAQPEAPAPVDCGARMHVCHAVCCKLNFALTAAEVEAGATKWDLGFPYMIRHESNGYCTHNDTATGGCGIYADRPGVCRRYSCANDTRIWKDFENMELNEEWIRENLKNRSRILVRPELPIMEINGVPTG